MRAFDRGITNDEPKSVTSKTDAPVIWILIVLGFDMGAEFGNQCEPSWRYKSDGRDCHRRCANPEPVWVIGSV